MLLTSETFRSRRFSGRASQVIHDTVINRGTGLVSDRDHRLLRLDQDSVAQLAHDALTEFGRVTEEDFRHLGLAGRLAKKTFANAVFAGWLGSDGALAERDPSELEPVLAHDFSTYQGDLFTRLAELCEADPESAALFPSDLTELAGLTGHQHDELYDNLIFNGVLDEDGTVLDPEFFADPDNVDGFPVNVDLNPMVPAVLGVLHERIARFHDEPLVLDPAIFADLRLTDAQLTDLRQSLRFNGYLDAHDHYQDKAALSSLPLTEFTLALEFYPHRGAVLDAVRKQIDDARAVRLTFAMEDFDEVADDVVTKRIIAQLAGGYVIDERATEGLRAFVSEPDAELPLGSDFTATEKATVRQRIASILHEQQPYQLDFDRLVALGFDPDEQYALIALLTERGELTGELTVARDRLDYFRTPTNALSFSVPGFEDYDKDVFFVLHAVANQVHDAMAEITDTVNELAQNQRTALSSGLQAAFGVSADTAEAICRGVLGSIENALDLLIAPALGRDGRKTDDNDNDTPVVMPTDGRFRLDYRRIRRFALLASKLVMTGTEVDLVFADRDLAAKFAEPLSLPPGVTRFDALLEDADGTVHLFADTSYWTYRTPGYVLDKEEPRPLSDLSSRFAELVAVDAAGTEPTGTAWLVGRDGTGVAQVFVRRPGGRHWSRRTQVWGKIRNNFADHATVDTAFVDEAGRTYLCCGDQYVRYSGSDYTQVDEGYPRLLGQLRDDEGLHGRVAAAFETALDASFQGRDGRLYLFKNDSFLTIGDGEDTTTRPIEEAWGRVRNELAETGRVDAAYTDGSAQFLLSGNQILSHSDCPDNNGLRVDDGMPVLIESHFGSVPAGFETTLDAALVDGNGVVHLFKDGRTTALTTQDRTVVPTAHRWGLLGPAFPSGGVDAAFVGLDGRTYLFSGAHYFRYTGIDYSRADLGYPRGISKDWGGLRQVDAAFVLEGKTYLFGLGGHLSDLDIAQEAALNAGQLSPAARDRFARYGLEFAPDVPVAGQSPQWNLTTVQGIPLTLTITPVPDPHATDPGAPPLRVIAVAVDPTVEARFHVSYSTRDYTKPDDGYPKPLSDNWWNLPSTLTGDAGVVTIDEVFTGRDNLTYLFSGNRFVTFDGRQRWWSQPQELAEHWKSIPFDHVDAAFVGPDGRTYLFSGQQYIRYTAPDHTFLDNGYPAPIEPFWGTVTNNITRTGRVDATLVMDFTDPVTAVETTYTYLFSGDQYVRYSGRDYGVVDEGYPNGLARLSTEPRLGNLAVTLDRVDAALADRHTVYLFAGDACHVVSDLPYRRYDQLGAGLTCAFLENGAVVAQTADGWRHLSSLEGTTVTASPVRPQALRKAPPGFRTGLDAVLTGTDGNTYLFQGGTCFNTELNRAYPLADEWGRPRVNIYHDNSVDTAFVGVDGKTYVFSGDQFVVYLGTSYLDAEIDGGPRPVAEHWAGLNNVALAYVYEQKTYLFEAPDPDGAVRYLVYSGSDYTRPDPGYPHTTDAGFWDIPESYDLAEVALPAAVVVEGDTLLLVIGHQCTAFSPSTGSWSYPRPLERIWPGLGLTNTDHITAVFTGRDGATYFFLAEEFIQYASGAAAPRRRTGQCWGRMRNDFTGKDGTGRVDAAMVFLGTTYLFSGDQYVRYSGPDYQFVDDGYPRPIAENLRGETAFAAFPDSFEDALGARIDAGAPTLIDAAVANDRTVYLFVGGDCHVASVTTHDAIDPAVVGKVRNTVVDRRKVDATLVSGDHTYLFSGDQYLRYTGGDYTFADEGYPKTLDSGLPAEFGVSAVLPEPFDDRIDAALRGSDGMVYLFTGNQYLCLAWEVLDPQPIAGTWGIVRNEFTADATNVLDAAFVAPSGELYAFRGDQYIRYGPLSLDLADEGYPRSIKGDWGELPPAFEAGLTGAFSFEDRIYLVCGDSYVRYSTDDFHAIDRTYPQTTRQRWGNVGDYRLTDIAPIARFADLAKAHSSDGLADFPRAGAEDPYAYLAKTFGWDADEVKWVRRSLWPSDEAPGQRGDIEFLLWLVDLFTVADKFGTGPSRLFADVWSRVHGPGVRDLDAAGDALAELLAHQEEPSGTADPSGTGLSAQVHDDLNLLLRDALLSAVTTLPSDPVLATPQDLFEHLLIDVRMGSTSRTSRIREATAAVQFYLHRYLLDLERPLASNGTDDEVRRALKAQWPWLHSYRLWEANRRVFLHPENYLRPELRPTKTPTFKALEEKLMQGEITADSVQKAYQSYLDEFTEVSRLVIAGGCVHADERADDTRTLVMFGRTRTDPRRYYYREAEFRGGDSLSTTWGPWLQVGIQIDADEVYPVYAFGRVFVFWTVIESVPPPITTTATAVPKDGGGHEISSPPPRHAVKIRYSFHDLNGNWIPIQELGTDDPTTATIVDPDLDIHVSSDGVPGQSPDDEHETITVTLRYYLPDAPVTMTEHHENDSPDTTIVLPVPRYRRRAHGVTAELSARWLDNGTELAIDQVDPVEFQRELVLRTVTADSPENAVDQARIVRFSSALHDEDWFAIDHRGSSFLYRKADTTFPDEIKPQSLKNNRDRLPKDWDRVDTAVELPNGVRYFFDNSGQRFLATPTKGRLGTPAPTTDRWPVSTVDTAYVDDGKLHLASGTDLYHYTINQDGSVADQPDGGPEPLAVPITATFARGDHRYFFAGGGYVKLDAGQKLTGDLAWQPVAPSWEGLPQSFLERFDTLLDGESHLYFFLNGDYIAHSKTAAVELPYERADLPYEIVRLTASTAAMLNQKLLVGGVPALLDLRTQEQNELPAFSIEAADSTTVHLNPDQVTPERLPASTHLDFYSANGIYYWEIFFHIPFLIAKALNNEQRFEDAKTWYEYIFDPTKPDGYWRLLPFVSDDLTELNERCLADVARLVDSANPDAEALDVIGFAKVVVPLFDQLTELAPAFRYGRPLTGTEVTKLRSLLGSTSEPGPLRTAQDLLEAAPDSLPDTVGADTRQALEGLANNVGIIGGLLRDYDHMADTRQLLKAYQDDPYDPHAIAALRPVAYRRAVVMAYIDNLLDWGDSLFRQYTPESVDEARLLYVLAYDLLGTQPEDLGTHFPARALSFADLDPSDTGNEELIAAYTADRAMLDGPGSVHASVASPYFSIPGNSTFAEYWDRVADRLRKIRLSENILGIVAPLPLFEPPIDPMSLVEGAAAGQLAAAARAGGGEVPSYRFNFLFGRAQELVDRLRQLGSDLLSILERRDGEQLSLLQNQQEGAILELTRAIKDAEVQSATETLAELRVSLDSANKRVEYYTDLVKGGQSPLEIAQLEMQTASAELQSIAAIVKIAATFLYGIPEVYAGVFNFGIRTGGKQGANIAATISDILSMTGQSVSSIGETIGTQAAFQRTMADWEQQQALARCDVEQINHQIAGAQQQLLISQRDREILEQQIAQNASVTTFMTDKFSNAQLYQWMSDRMSDIFFQTYNLAYDLAKATERAYLFESGQHQTTYIQPAYWDNRRKGLLAGESLGLDLDRLGKAYLDTSSRGLEITKQISLLGLDPMALIRLKTDGVCEFTLSEELFDYDFPGHFRRQIRTITVSLADADGQVVDLNAVLTQLGHKTVLEADPKVVKYLLDPKGPQPAALRTDWRASQQIALSHVDDQSVNNGLFELRYDDDRYLPFEGTGVVSSWRLEVSGGHTPAALQDVLLTLKYTADRGGDVFANAVKGMLKPYPAARFLNIAKDFAQEWQDFMANHSQSLTLPVTPALFPNIKGSQITGVYPKYDLTNGSAARFVLNGNSSWALDDGKLLTTPGLAVSANGGSGWTLQLDGDKTALTNLGMILTYQAGVQ